MRLVNGPVLGKFANLRGQWKQVFSRRLPQTKAAAFPQEDLDPVASPVTKHKEMLREWVQAQAIFHQYRQAIDALAEVDRVPAQIHHRRSDSATSLAKSLPSIGMRTILGTGSTPL
jgi:hypothetical protein